MHHQLPGPHFSHWPTSLPYHPIEMHHSGYNKVIESPPPLQPAALPHMHTPMQPLTPHSINSFPLPGRSPTHPRASLPPLSMENYAQQCHPGRQPGVTLAEAMSPYHPAPCHTPSSHSPHTPYTPPLPPAGPTVMDSQPVNGQQPQDLVTYSVSPVISEPCPQTAANAVVTGALVSPATTNNSGGILSPTSQSQSSVSFNSIEQPGAKEEAATHWECPQPAHGLGRLQHRGQPRSVLACELSGSHSRESAKGEYATKTQVRGWYKAAG